jgi:hypothetical protein
MNKFYQIKTLMYLGRNKTDELYNYIRRISAEGNIGLPPFSLLLCRWRTP